MNTALLALEDGTVFPGVAFGAPKDSSGEVVFNTAITGYQEIFTDPSYSGQIVVLTNPQIGNYGANDYDQEAGRPHIEGLVVREFSSIASNWRSMESADEFLKENGVAVASGIDTRALVRHLRTRGVMRGVLSVTGGGRDELVERARQVPSMAGLDLATRVSTNVTYGWDKPVSPVSASEKLTSLAEPRFHVVAYDFGTKRNILRRLVTTGARVTVVPASTTAEDVLGLKPDGVFLSNGPGDPERFHQVYATEDERYAILQISDRGQGKDGNALFYRDLSNSDKKFLPIVSEITDDSFGVIDHVGGKFLVQTNHHAPNNRVALFDPSNATSPWTDVIPEKPEKLEGADTGGGKLFVTYSKDVSTRAYAYSLDGKLENEIHLPGPRNAVGFGGNHDDKFVFYHFASFNFPTTIFKYDIGARQSNVFRSPDIPGFHPESYETKQVFYTSKDGARIPMFLVHKKGLALNGANPTLLYAYGGFNISIEPAFDPLLLGLLEQGFVYASANLRGGGEYGEQWHQAGMKVHKQNVFDDFIAAADWLIANHYTSPEKLAVNGGSNGGLLIGAVMNQRPDLFRVAVPQVGVMDMLRFQKFTIGWNWIADYGSSDNPEEFQALYAYSPLHNIRAGVKYPATLITTADHDDRVVPAHSFKYAATLQEKASPSNPVLIRIDTRSGHGASNTKKAIETRADVYAFIMYNLGVTPHF